MQGMDMTAGANMFQTTNKALALDFWYIIVGVLGLLAVLQLVNLYKARTRWVIPAPNKETLTPDVI